MSNMDINTTCYQFCRGATCYQFYPFCARFREKSHLDILVLSLCPPYPTLLAIISFILICLFSTMVIPEECWTHVRKNLFK